MVSTRVMTPEYASPEQVSGGEITTMSDIYSLGAVLYRLLTGRPPHVTEQVSALDLARRIADESVPRASNVPAEVSAILEKALHGEPSRRYGSADDLCDDIRRFLEGKPVLAVPDSFFYQTTKFLKRHWIPVTALAAILLTLTLATVVSFGQARKAERRFSEVRQLSNRFLFEFEGAIHNVPGTLPARKLIVKTAQEYLDRLAGEGGSGIFRRQDPELIHELAEAYRKLGDVQGNPVESNAGDSRGALANYRKALALREVARDETSSDTKVRMDYLTTLYRTANAEAESGDRVHALKLHQKSAVLAEGWLQKESRDPDLLNTAADVYSQLSVVQRTGGASDSALASAKRSLALRQQALGLRPSDSQLQRAVAVSHWAVAAAEKSAGRPEEAVAEFTITVDLLRRAVAANPGNAKIRRDLLGASWLLAGSVGDLLAEQKKSLEGTVPLWEDAWRNGLALLKEDPANALVESDVALISVGLANTLEELKRPKEALAVLIPAVFRQGNRHRSNPDSRPVASYLAVMEVLSADCYMDLGNFPDALRNVRAAISILDTLSTNSPDVLEYQFTRTQAYRSLGRILTGQGDYQGARAAFHEGLELASKMPQGHSVYDPSPLITEIKEGLSRAASEAHAHSDRTPQKK
jgi:tetratricopeptide (TPR) repeat protein